MTQEGISDGRLRIGVRGGGCAGFTYDMAFDSMEYDNEMHPVSSTADVDDKDVLFHEFGVTYIADKKTLALIRGTVIDYVETLRDSGFKFKNPLATATCGCDKSFT